jgi:hypothetical protein
MAAPVMAATPIFKCTKDVLTTNSRQNMRLNKIQK